MRERINENIYKDTGSPEANGNTAGLEIVKTPELKKISVEISNIKDAIDRDGVVGLGDIERIGDALEGLIVDVGGEKMTIENMKRIPDLKMNVEIWKEVEGGNFKRISELTRLSDNLAEYLSTCKRDLYLYNLTHLSDRSAEALAKHEGNLYIQGVTSISDRVAEALSRHKGEVNLNGLTNLSDQAAKSLSRHKDMLWLGMEAISEQAAKYISEHGGKLVLGRLVSLSDQAAELLSGHKGTGLYLNRLISMSDQAAEKLSKYKGYLNIRDDI